MKIEVLYVPGCPHHHRAMLKLRQVLAAEGIAAGIVEVAVHNIAAAEVLHFGGSPSILINGRDIATESGDVLDFAVSCRLYPGSSEVGVPPVEMIRQAVRDARREYVKKGSDTAASAIPIPSSLYDRVLAGLDIRTRKRVRRLVPPDFVLEWSECKSCATS